MTSPTNRPPDERLEERLAESFDRAVKRAELDLADGRLAAEAIDRGHRRNRTGAMWRAGLVLAAVAVLSAGTLWVVGGRPPPPPSPAPSLANAPGTPHPSVSVVPTDANGSQIPQPEDSGYTVVDPGVSFPATVDGRPVYALGGAAEARLASVTDATPILISGWYLPLRDRRCSFPSLDSSTMTPGVTYFDKCISGTIFAEPSGGASIQVLIGVTTNGPQGQYRSGVFAARAYVNPVLVEVHRHDLACAIPECATDPVLDRTVLSGTPVMNPGIVAQTPPAKMVSMADAVAIALPKAQDMLGIGTPAAVFVSAALGTAAVLDDYSVHTDAITTWEWKVVFVTPDGSQVVTVWVDAVSGGSDHAGSTTGGGLANP